MASIEEGLRQIAELGAADNWLAVLVTQRESGDPAPTVVNAGLVKHPLTGEQAVAFVSRGNTLKLRNLRRDPRATLVFRAGWEWTAVAGPVELIGPDDELPGFPAEQLPQLIREIYAAAGGTHPDPAEFDRVMAADRRTVALVTPERFTVNVRG
ncbi:pyridoxamine 5'-phosphate oxidase family protein [Kitasatospora sp. NPDC002227]|uniref:pyridoxamine 5'-phosphate oxidase family protein n=1 Tax=Kitasatospora sp. NPDC002227 TaxID=3154773 RepID=UPI0033302A27